MGLTGCVPKCR